MPEQFHFLHPLWFLALIPMVLVLWLLQRPAAADSSWRRVCDSHLLPYVLSTPRQRAGTLATGLLAAGWLLAVVALADPVWQKQPQPVYRSQQARVVVLDLSRSMLSTDLKPSRLQRARLKVADILKQSHEGQTGLVVFAGDAFAVSPLTSDTNTIRALLDPLQPELMPVQGSRLDLGLEQAAELFKRAGVRQGDILAVTDGSEDTRAVAVARKLHASGYRVSVLGVGTTDPAPVPDGQGGYVRDASGSIVMPALHASDLRELAAAGGGDYSGITPDTSDLKRLLRPPQPTLTTDIEQTDLKTDLWQSQGPWLVLLLLPLAALAFRRGWLLSLPLVIVAALASAPPPAMASTWDDLWLRRDQQADAALQAGDPQRAQALATQPLRRGTAAYRAGNYAQAMQAFADSQGPQGDYNRGNALAKLGRYREAIAAYDQALQADPDLEDATYNRAQVARLLQQQQQQQQQAKDNSGQGKSGADQQGQDGGASQQRGEGAKHSSGDDTSADSAAGNSESGQKAKHAGERRSDAGSNPDQGTGEGATEHRQPKSAESPSSPGQQSGAKAGAGQGAGRDTAQQAHKQAAEQARQDHSGSSDAAAPQAATAATADDLNPLTSEQQQADERWLRRIPDDPGGLLRRKFLYQYSQRGVTRQSGDQTW
jgi:Ca-activated chloride channel family protein